MKLRRRWIVVSAIALLAVAVLFAVLYLRKRSPAAEQRRAAEQRETVGPADLERLQDEFEEGREALAAGDGARAVRRLRSFEFTGRAVEEYRLYYLANAYQLTGDTTEARRTLSRLWQRKPKLIYREDVGFNTAALYAGRGALREASEVYGTLATEADDPNVEAAARWEYIQLKLAAGDPVAALHAARNIIIKNPKSAQAGDAAALVRALRGAPADSPIGLTLPEQVQRGSNLLRDGDPQSAIAELEDIDADSIVPTLSAEVRLTRGLALQRLRRFEDSEKALAPLLTGAFRWAVPASMASARNHGALAASINPERLKTVTQKKRVGTVKVRVKGKKKLVSRPRYKNVKKTIKLIDLAAKARKEEHERTRSERLKDVVEMPYDPAARKEALTALLVAADKKDQWGYMQQLATEIVKLDRTAEPALQRFWDRAWAAYLRRDFATALPLFEFIAGTYVNPNIRRQAMYWTARVKEKQGNKEEAQRIFERLVDTPFEDVYAVFIERRGIKRPPQKRPRLEDAPNFADVAEKQMPPELKLAYELTVLGANREARTEVQRNVNDANRRWGDALFGMLLHSAGAEELSYRSLRRAFPELATTEQMKVPRQVLAMYYPLRYEDTIRDYAEKRDLDPFLVMALIRQESSYDPTVKSPVGATGLMQIMPSTGRELGRRLRKPFAEQRLSDPELNIELGTYYLKQLISWVGGSTEAALAAYNGGIGNVRKWQGAFRGRAPDEFIESIPFSETRGYVKRITLMRGTYRELHQDLRSPGR